MRMLADGFADPVLSTWWQTSTSTDTTAITTGDGLAIAFTEAGDATVAATRFLDLREGQFSVAIDAAAGRISLQLVAASDPADALSIVRDGGTLTFATDIEGTHTDLVALPYDAVAHHYWRIEDTGTAIVWSTSADGATFTPQHSLSRLAWVTYVKPVLSVHADAPLTATFRDVNNSITSGSACAAALLTDDFAGATIADHWQWSAQRGSLSPQDGHLEAYYPPGQQAAMRLTSSTIYDLRDGVFAFELPIAIPQTAGVYITIATLAGSETELRENGGTFQVISSPTAPDQPPPPLPKPTIGKLRTSNIYDPTTDRWIRARESVGTVIFESSPDGVLYSIIGQSPVLGGFDRATISFLFNGSSVDIETPLVIALDNFNVGP